MRKIVKTTWGMEIVYAQEDWFTASYIEIGLGKTTPYRKAPFDIVFDILEGTARFTINGKTYDFHKGKTISIKKGTKYSIMGIDVPKLNKIAKTIMKDEDFSPY